MSDEPALLSAVCAHPDEDTPRLAYADWLDEHADALPGRDPAEVRARAEFIRLQIAFDGRDGDPEFDDARDRAAELFARYEHSWQPPGAGRWVFGDELKPSYWEFRRGFAEHPHIAPELFAEYAAALCAVAPVRELDVKLTGVAAEALARCPHLRHIRTLGLALSVGMRPDLLRVIGYPDPGVGEYQWRQLLDSPHLTGVRELKLDQLGHLFEFTADRVAHGGPFADLQALELGEGGLSVPFVASLTVSDALRLRRLTAAGGDLGGVGARLLAGSPVCERLEVLHLRGCQLTPTGVEALAASPHLGSLWNLNLWGDRVGEAGVRALARGPGLANLRALGLEATRPGAAGLAALGRAERLGGLRRLALADNALRPGAGKALAEGPAFARLLSLDLDRNGIGDGGAAHLGDAHSLNELRRLSLSQCLITEAGFRALAAGSGLPALTHLDLGSNRIAGGIAALTDTRFPNLRVLKLNSNVIDDAGAIALAKSPQLATVEELDLRSNKITDAGAKALMESPHLTKVRRLEVTRNKLSRAVKAAFEKRFTPTPA